MLQNMVLCHIIMIMLSTRHQHASCNLASWNSHKGKPPLCCFQGSSTLLRYISFENQGQYRDHLVGQLISGHLPLLIPDRPLQTGFAISRIIAIRSSVSQKSMDIGMKGSSCGEDREGEENQISDHPSLKLCCTDSVLLTIWRHSPSFIFLNLYCKGCTICAKTSSALFYI